MKEKSTNSPLLVIDHDNSIVEGLVGFETTNALTTRINSWTDSSTTSTTTSIVSTIKGKPIFLAWLK